MRRVLFRGAIVLTVLLAGIWAIQRNSPPLPRIKLAGGGEFRVYKICFGGPDDHQLGGSAKPVIWAWKQLPLSLQRIVPAPSFGDSGLSPFQGHTALSVYWGWVETGTQKPVHGPSGNVLMTTDSGEESELNWPYPFDAADGSGYRQIFVDEPPRNSSRLRFRVPVEDETVEFTINNPAYGK